MIEFYEDTRYSLTKDMKLSQKLTHIFILAAFIYSLHGLLFDGFNKYPIRSELASLMFAIVAVISITFLYLMNRIKRYPFIFACGTTLLFYTCCVIIGIENRTSLFFINSTIVFLLIYFYFISTTDLENPNPQNTRPKPYFEDDGFDVSTNISGQVSEGGNFWVGFMIVFGKSFLITVAALSLFFITIEIFIS